MQSKYLTLSYDVKFHRGMAGGIRHDYQSSIYFSLHGSIHDAKQSINLYGQVEQAICKTLVGLVA